MFVDKSYLHPLRLKVGEGQGDMSGGAAMDISISLPSCSYSELLNHYLGTGYQLPTPKVLTQVALI